jgi:ribosomal protein S18 acetylase RimI-like enzyme
MAYSAANDRLRRPVTGFPALYLLLHPLRYDAGMAAYPAGEVTIAEAPPAGRHAALEWLLSDWTAPARSAQLLELSALAATPPHRLLEARRDGVFVGSTFLRFQAGATAFVWTPRTAAVGGDVAATALVRAAGDLAVSAGAAMVQGLTEVVGPEGGWFAAAGFEHAADLVYLCATQDCFPATAPASELDFEPYTPACRARLATLVTATYDGTLDCPTLNGRRSPEDVLAGYQATGAFDPSRWLFARHAGRDVGCVLLADHVEGPVPAQPQMELVYMGLVPEARGRGWGRHLARQAQWLARQAGRPRLLLAVDAANAPALAAYTAVGFATLGTRAVWLRFPPAALAPR